MSAQALCPSDRAFFKDDMAVTAPLPVVQSAGDRPAIDLAGAHIYVQTADGCDLQNAWYFAAKPRAGAVIVGLARTSFRNGRPAGAALLATSRFLKAGVSVLLVDFRDCEELWGQVSRRYAAPFLEAAGDYLEARGHERDGVRIAEQDGRCAL